MKDSTQKNEGITQKEKEPIVSFEVIELDDAVLDCAVGGWPIQGCMNNCGPYKMK